MKVALPQIRLFRVDTRRQTIDMGQYIANVDRRNNKRLMVLNYHCLKQESEQFRFTFTKVEGRSGRFFLDCMFDKENDDLTLPCHTSYCLALQEFSVVLRGAG